MERISTVVRGESRVESCSAVPAPRCNSPLSTGYSPLLQSINLHRYLGQGESVAHILRGVNLSLNRGEYASIVGASGSGKSTLLYLLGGLDRPSRKTPDGAIIEPASRVRIDGSDTAELSDAQLGAVRNAKIGFVFQFHYLLKEFTAAENVALPMLKLGRLSRADTLDRAAMLLNQLGLGAKTKRRANRLSGGEQQRVAIARALANEPAALLADEPTGNLDKANSDRVAHVFDELAAGGQTILIVTHDLALAGRAKRQIRMEDGNVISDSPTQ
ncbi:MAG: ABC transporter ATP-binding protein [Tepidisphaeraceae bacterium]